MVLKITMPNEDVTYDFTNFNKAVRFCEKEFGYGDEIEVRSWKSVKKSKKFSLLKDFLWEDGLWVELHD